MNILRFLRTAAVILLCTLNSLLAHLETSTTQRTPVGLEDKALLEQTKKNEQTLDLEDLLSFEQAEPVRPKQIGYAYKTEIVFGDTFGQELPVEIENHAKKIYKNLNSSPYFNTSFLCRIRDVRQHHADLNNPDRGQLMSFMTEDGVEIRGTYFDRGGDELVVVGSGFTTPREYMSAFVEMFKAGITGKNKGRDVLLIDLRGHGYEERRLCDPSTWNFNLAKNTMRVDSRLTKLGAIEELDVLAVVRAMRKHKQYKQVLGLSVCYSAFIFLKTEALYPGTFDKMVVDGCWDTLELFIEKLKTDPVLLVRSHKGGLGNCAFFQQKFVQDSLFWLAKNVWGLEIEHDISMVREIPKIKNTPLLFFYGKKDLVVYRNEFEALWNAACMPFRVAVVTSNHHCLNQYKQKELYKFLCESFFASSTTDEFNKRLSSIDMPVIDEV